MYLCKDASGLSRDLDFEAESWTFPHLVGCAPQQPCACRCRVHCALLIAALLLLLLLLLTELKNRVSAV